ncbi:hypothetical protein GCM10023162_15630 [Klenkia terrae]
MRAGSVRAGAVTVPPSSHAGTTENAIACRDVSGDALPVSSPGSPRLPYADLPAGLRAAVDDALGSPVVSVSPRTGGFSAGPAAVLTCASGRRVFVKAVGTQIDRGTLELVRREGRTAALLPASLPVPALVAQVDHVAPDGSAWTALLLEEVAGAAPATPWTVEAARAVLDDVAACTAAATPCPVPGLPPFAAVVGDDLAGWALLVDEPPADLTGWEREHLDRLVGVPDRLLDRGGCVGDSLVHTDLRADNLLVTPDGGTVLLDWAWQKDPAAPQDSQARPGPLQQGREGARRPSSGTSPRSGRPAPGTSPTCWPGSPACGGCPCAGRPRRTCRPCAASSAGSTTRR